MAVMRSKVRLACVGKDCKLQKQHFLSHDPGNAGVGARERERDRLSILH